MYFPKLKLLFIHIPKNAGTSVENTILQYCNNKYDIWSQKIFDLVAKHEVTWTIISNIVFIDKNNTLFNATSQYHKMLSEHQPENDIILSVVRHPQERIVSLYKFSQMYKLCDFETFVKEYVGNAKTEFIGRTQLEYLSTPSGRQDKRVHILRYENLDEDWKQFCNKYDLDCGPLLKENVSSAKVVVKWTDELRKIVYRQYKCDFKTFGYELY